MLLLASTWAQFDGFRFPLKPLDPHFSPPLMPVGLLCPYVVGERSTRAHDRPRRLPGRVEDALQERFSERS